MPDSIVEAPPSKGRPVKKGRVKNLGSTLDDLHHVQIALHKVKQELSIFRAKYYRLEILSPPLFRLVFKVASFLLALSPEASARLNEEFAAMVARATEKVEDPELAAEALLSHMAAFTPPDKVKPKLPDVAPVLYDRESGIRASDFLREHWGRYIDAGAMYRPDLIRLDRGLKLALDNEFRRDLPLYAQVLPKQTAAIDAEIEAELGRPPEPGERYDLARRVSLKRWARKSSPA